MRVSVSLRAAHICRHARTPPIANREREREREGEREGEIEREREREREGERERERQRERDIGNSGNHPAL